MADETSTPPAPGTVQIVPDPTTENRAKSDKAQMDWDLAKLQALREGWQETREVSDFAHDREAEEQADYRDKDLHLKDAEAAHEWRQERRREDAKSREQYAEQVRQHEERQIDEDIAATKRWSPEDGARGAEFIRRENAWQTRHQAFQKASAWAEQKLAELAQRDSAAAEGHRQALARQFAAEWQGLANERAVLDNAAQIWNTTGTAKAHRANQKSLMKNIPELRDPEVADEFIDNIAKRTGATKDYIKQVGIGVTDPVELERLKSLVNQEWRAFQKEKQDEREAEYDRYFQQRSRDNGLQWRTGGVKGTEEGLLEEVRRTGSQKAAELYLMAARTRAREKRRGRL